MVFETNIICFEHMKHMKKKPNSQDECGVGERGGIIVCGLLPPPTDSFHRCGGPPPSKREVFGEGRRDNGQVSLRGARRVIGAIAKPLYAIGGKAGGLERRTIR